MASIISNLEHRPDRSSHESKRKKRRKIDNNLTDQSTTGASSSHHQTRWRSLTEQQKYSSKLVEALRRVRRNSESSSSAVRGRLVRDTADKILAIAARGRSRWSRAILRDRMKLRLMRHKKVKHPTTSRLPPPPTGDIQLRSRETGEKAPPPLLQRRVRVLGRLVPGCRKLSFPNLLEETTDYIAALQMQIRAMTELADLLTGAQAESTSRRERELT